MSAEAPADTETNRGASTEQKEDTGQQASDQGSNQGSPTKTGLVGDKKNTESSEAVVAVVEDTKQSESLVLVSNESREVKPNGEEPRGEPTEEEPCRVEPNGEEPHRVEPPVKQAWGDELTSKDSARDNYAAPQSKESEVSPILVQDIEEEMTSSISVSEVPPAIEDVFSTPVAPSPQVSYILVLVHHHS